MFIQYHGNDLAALRELACQRLATDPPPPLEDEVIVVPNAGMGRWLRQGIAQSLGVVAGVQCVSPAAFISRLAADLLQPSPMATSADPYAKEYLTWALMKVLSERIEAPVFEPLRQYLGSEPDQLQALGLSRRLAELYDQYLYFRPHWLLSWETGQDQRPASDFDQLWQPALWRELTTAIATVSPDTEHGAKRIQCVLDAVAAQPDRSRLPKRLLVFGLTALSPVLLQLIRSLARVVDVHLFHFNPCESYWADLVDLRTQARWQLEAPEKAALSDVGHPLLSSWGKLVRDSVGMLQACDEADIRDVFRTRPQRRLLDQLGNGILTLSVNPQPIAIETLDESVCFAEATSPMREVEALHDHLLHLFEVLPNLTPRDIVIMAPDVNIYAPFIEAVFDQWKDDPRHIPYTIADREGLQQDRLLAAIVHMLSVSDSAFEASVILQWLTVPAIGRRFGIESHNVDEVSQWVKDSGIRRGSREGDRTIADANSWEAGIERLLLGVAMDGHQSWQGITPVPIASGQVAATLGLLAEYIERLKYWMKRLQAPRTIAQWCEQLRAMVTSMVDVQHVEAEAELARLWQLLGQLPDRVGVAGFDQPLSQRVFSNLLEEGLEQDHNAHRFLRGGATVSTLTPLRSIPFRVVCILGLTADSYPRVQRPPDFDLMAKKPVVGDRSRRDDDRQLFLEAVLSARDCLYLSRVGLDERGKVQAEPSVLWSELCDFIDHQWTDADGRPLSGQLLRKHPLKPFDPRYFEDGAALFSYQHHWCLAGTMHTEVKPLEAVKPPSQIEWSTFERFIEHPCRGFLNQRLGVFFRSPDQGFDDSEPMSLDPLAQYSLKDGLAAVALADGDVRQWTAQQRQSGAVQPGYAGQLALEKTQAKLSGLIEQLAHYRHQPATSAALDLEVAGHRLVGTLAGLRGGTLVNWHAGTVTLRHLLKWWINHLAGSAAGVLRQDSVLLSDTRSWRVAVCEPAEALRTLQLWFALYTRGQQTPLPLFPRASLAYASQRLNAKDPQLALAAAHIAYVGERSRGDQQDGYIARLYPSPAAALNADFERLAEEWVVPLLARWETST